MTAVVADGVAALPATPVRPRRARGRRSAWTWRLVGVVVLFSAWELVATRVADPAVFPAPGLVVRDLQENFAGSRALQFLGLEETSYLGNLRYTAVVVLTAWLAGATLGVVGGVLASRVQPVRDLVEPVTSVFGVVPALVAAPFALIWFGFGAGGQWALVAFFSAVTVAGATMVAALSVPPRYEEYAATLGIGRRDRLRHVVLPRSMPATLAAIRAALAAAWGMQTIVELLGSQLGVGRVISVRAGTGDVAAVLAVIAVVGIAAALADLAFVALARRALRWQAAETGRGRRA